MALSARENILNRIKKALQQKTAMPFPNVDTSQSVFPLPEDDLSVLFARQFTSLQGQFLFCENKEALHQRFLALIREKNWQDIYCAEPSLHTLLQFAERSPCMDLSACDISVTGCSHLVARTGTIVLTAAQESGRTASVYAPIHVCVAYTRQLVYDLSEALQTFSTQDISSIPSLISFASGPSRTADIEKTLVTGVHGPKEVYCLLVEG